MSKYNQTITLWSYEGLDMNGVRSYAAPVTVKVRYEETNRLITDNQGREIQGQGVAYFPEKIFKIGDYLIYGEYTDLLPVKGSYEIKNQRSIPNLSGTEWEHRAMF